MKYAPILIPTLCRYDHFRQCIESLQKNSWAKYTELYIALDYPAKESHWEGYKKIEAYLDGGIEGFAEVHIIKRKENYGITGERNNLYCLIDDVRKKYDRIICTEDDNVFSPCFIEYIDTMLQLSEKDPSVMAVCGYSYPVKWKDNGCGVIREQSFFSAWGYGCFINKETWKLSYYNEEYQKNTIKSRKFLKLWKSSKKNFCYFSGLCWHKKLVKHDIARSCLMTLENMYCIMPTVSMVRNCGWDGSGFDCRVDKNSINYMEQTISEENSFEIELESSIWLPHNVENEIIINNYFEANMLDILKSWIRYLLLYILN